MVVMASPLSLLHEEVVACRRCPRLIAHCAQFLDREIAVLSEVRVIVALGRIGFDASLNYLKRRGELKSKQPFVFAHGAEYRLPDGRILLASYHPSNQNTQTGKLTEKMFTEIFRRAARLARSRYPVV